MKTLFAILLLAIVGLQYRLWVGEGSLAHVVRLKTEIEKQEAENGRLEARNRLLAAEVHALKHGTQGIEERARQQMGMIKHGETFFMIVDDSQ